MRLLIADDEVVIRNGLLTLPWKSIGITQVECSDNGMEAMKLVCDFHPNVILADIQMPGITGLELAHFVREQNLQCRLILLSGYGTFDYAREAIKFGVFEYLLKPSSPQEILESVKRAVKSLEKESLSTQAESFRKVSSNISLSGNNTVSEILNYLESNYMADISLESLSESMHFSTAYLSRLIKKETGYNFVWLLTMIRMLKAAEFLTTTDLKVYAICERVGIPDPRYFSQIFRRTFGHTPLEYQKMHRQKGISNLQDILGKSKGEYLWKKNVE